MKLFNPHFAKLGLLIVACMGAIPGVAAEVSCDDWNTEAFFKLADAGDVARCLNAGADVNAQVGGYAPLHVAAQLKNPAVMEALLDAGANPAARDGQDKTPWDYVKGNPVLMGTEAYMRLKEAAGGTRNAGEPKELREIKVYGTYYSGDPKEIEDIEEYYRKRGVLKEGESLADIPYLAHKLVYLGKERLRIRSRPVIYCYGRISDEDRESAVVFNTDLRARMYDREGNLLAEDVLRDRIPGRHPFAKFTAAYLPYLKNGDVVLRFVRLEKGEEIVFYELKSLHSHEYLLEHERSKTRMDTGCINTTKHIVICKPLRHLQDIQAPSGCL